jgi:hypothetical protein
MHARAYSVHATATGALAPAPEPQKPSPPRSGGMSGAAQAALLAGAVGLLLAGH